MRRDSLDNLRRQLPLPDKLLEMIESGRWVHPGDEAMRAKVPFIRDPLMFLNSKEHMFRESGPLMGSEEIENEMFSEYRGSAIPERELPWIDVERTLFIIINKIAGDDVGIALDYRTRVSPHVIGSEWGIMGCKYHEISPSFDAFVELLGL